MSHIITSILQNTLMITSFVLVMMLLIEYLNVISKGKWMNNFQNSKYKQVFVAALLGIIPGCLGGFAVVSLFTHNVVNFGALIACMIATFGDEAFIMFAMIPETAILLTVVIFIIAVITGIVINLFVKKFPTPFSPEHYAIHQADKDCHENIKGNWKKNLKHISFERALLMTGIVLIIVAILMGWFEHSHDAHDIPIEHTAHIHVHDQECTVHDHHHEHTHGDFSSILLEERWLNILFVVICLIALFIITTVQDHFLKEHLWGHIIKKHLPKIFFWTLGVLTVLQVGQQFLDIDEWVRGNQMYILLLAVLIGIIPESGPHIIFITLFANGSIPFSILLANSIVQDGHAGLPLLAESKRGFFWMKGISVLIGLLAGLAGYFFNF
ncbi:MAG: putative manganese transporter [Bacteroidales bacterium]|jgi:hypothetical protein|nr:putative manganese transporter [Bacteroidales bacterium]